eukprot:TRINITY_DN2157_c0_g1_i1.p1 TRINITY_DN2157_c0_g1~~TRINITY_DN2157_c0_g1_i1.p1  ORF type:complete len:206 (-),score=29.40 TRINITY_DN2157_c0_g1_i1:232-849(-)
MKIISIALLLFISYVLITKGDIVAPVLPNEYSITFNAPNVGSYPSESQMYYDWNLRRQVTQHTACIAGPSKINALPCSIIMMSNMTFVASYALDGGCCRLPDGDVAVPTPNAYQSWDYVGNSTVNGELCYDFMNSGFHWMVSQKTMQPMLFEFASGGIFYFTSPIKKGKPSESHFFLPDNGCIEKKCPFCWFPPDGMCNSTMINL